MKRAILLFVLLLAAPSPCRADLYYFLCDGYDLNLTTREQVRKHFGKRLTSGAKDGRPYDEVRYHGKPYEEVCNLEGMGREMLFVMTCGLSELVMVPRDLFRIGRTVIVGYKIRYFYDESNQVIARVVDGNEITIEPTLQSDPPF